MLSLKNAAPCWAQLYLYENTLHFFGEYKGEINYSVYSIDATGFRLSFDNIFGNQEGQIKEYITGGSGLTWKELGGQRVTSRVIQIDCILSMPSEEGLAFKPDATFTFEYFRIY